MKAIEKAEQLRGTRRQMANSGKFYSLEMNRSGNRPVRAVVNENVAQYILQKDMCQHGESAIRQFGGDLFDFGDKHDRVGVSKRKRSVVSLKAMEEFFSDSGGVEGLENRLLETLFHPHADINDGVLVADVNGMLLPHRLYNREDYRLIAAFIFNDPPNSPEQNLHEDVAGCDRDAIWNIIFPLKLTQCAKMAATEFRLKGGREMNSKQATMWDGCWPHRGLGNHTQDERIFLHLLVAPYWMVTPDSANKEFNGLSEEKRRMLVQLSKQGVGDSQWQFLQEVQYGNDYHNGISQEYNNGLPLTATASEFHVWVDRLLNEKK